MEPFNGDYTSSIFASIDNVAISSVAHDFLRTEYNSEDWDDEAYPNYDGTDDYLQQAADSSFWPDDITYDPEDDGTPLKSLGVHEHWNNADDKQYSRDLQTGNGIELVKILHDPSTIKTEPVYAAGFALYQNFPNPFNPSTSIAFQLKEAGHVELSVYNELGQKIETLINSNQPTGYKEVKWNGANRPSGVYFYRLIVNSNNQKQIMQKKMLLVK
ncbi:MAG: T9SS C-terminal target domain-containing protein [Calditrichaeota bacterium]|nr:MAG: T9SS C-terminal target domain-containing protein [Calditrichota bacterium]